MTKQVYWTNLVLNTFLKESGIEERVELGDEKAKRLERVMRTRCAGYSIVSQADLLNVSIDTIKKDIRELKDLYDATQEHSLILPKRRKTKKELELDREF